jgi:tRNA(adenine34) deaminase
MGCTPGSAINARHIELSEHHMRATKRPKSSSTARKGTARKGRTTSSSEAKSGRRWSASVHTESTFPPKGLFNKDASTIAKNLASKRTSPKGPASGMRMLNFYINRAGHNLSASRKKELQRAKSILSEIITRKRGTPDSKAKKFHSPQRH